MTHRSPHARFGLIGAVVLATVVVIGFASPAPAFPDVPGGHPYQSAVDGLASRGIIAGYPDGTFGIDNTVKRAQFAKMIVNTLGIAPSASTVTRFVDLGAPDVGGYPHIYVQAAYDNGITKGTDPDETLFLPWAGIRRDQVVTMIVRGVDRLHPGVLADPQAGTTSLFSGVGAPHGENLRVAEHNGLLDGLTGMGAAWNVTAPATRGEVAQMLWNLLDLLPGGTNPPHGDEGIWVYADGSGDYPTLEAAVDAVGAGATINVGPGTFVITYGLWVTKDLTLAGVGSTGTGGTTLSCAGRVLFVDGAALTAEAISFVCTATGSQPANVVEARDAEIELSDCRFAGGNKGDTPEGDEYVPFKGNGLYLCGTTTGSVTGCVFTQNDNDGLAVDDHAEVALATNECAHNGGSGISVHGSAVCAITSNTCDSNESCGIEAGGTVEITATDNLCRENGADGISADLFAVGALTGNTCSDNGMDGIYAGNGTQVAMTGNVCLSNAEAGIRFGPLSSGSALNNECAGNTWGIYVHDTASPTIGANALHDNTHDFYEE